MKYVISCLKKQYDKCAVLWKKANEIDDPIELELNYKRMMQLKLAISILNVEIRESELEFCVCGHLSIHFYGEICEHCNKPIVFQNSEERT